MNAPLAYAKSFCGLGLALVLIGLPWQAFAQADWVHVGPDGKLVYKKDGNGNRVMDFSSAGYMGGGVAIPVVPGKITLSPSGGDDKSAIQNAIDKVSAMPMTDGFRGAVVLSAGTFKTSGPITISSSGVVLRGAGSGAQGTIINASGGAFFRMSGSGSHSTSNKVNISGSYLSVGSMQVTVAGAAGFAVGDNILITKPVTAAWIHSLGMDNLVRNGARQTWIGVGSDFTTDRTITAINGNQLTLDGPITDNFDQALLGSPIGTVANYAFPGRIERCGLEHLRVIAPANVNTFSHFRMSKAKDSWVRDVFFQDGVNCFNIDNDIRRVTVENVILNHTIAVNAAAPPADFNCLGTQVFFNKCQSRGRGMWPWTCGGGGTGPIVLLDFTSVSGGIAPHMRWTTGILADMCTLPGATDHGQGIAFRNRSWMGSGHGWTTAWSIGWNIEAPYILVSQAPGTLNWAIGGHGVKNSIAGDPDGIYDHFNSTVAPRSLYLAQLQERLGPQALANIGYGSSVAIAVPRQASSLPKKSAQFHIDGRIFPGGHEAAPRRNAVNRLYSK